MSAWISAVPELIVALVAVIGPGAVLVSVAGARGLDRFALAAPVSFAVAGVTAVIAGVFRLPFNPITFLVGVAVLAVLVWVVRILLRRRRLLGEATVGSVAIRSEGGGSVLLARLTLVAAVVVPAVLIAWRLMRGIESPDRIAQLFDNVFHLNAVELISQTQAGSSLTIGNLTEASRGFYPAALHDLVALVVQLGGFTVPSALNVSAIVMAAVVWPLSVLFLTVRILGSRPLPLLLAGVLSAGFAAFPYLLMSWGLLAPLSAADAMLPVALGLLIEVFGVRRADARAPIGAAAALVAVFVGIGLTHPSAVVAALLFASPFAIAGLIEAVRVAPRPDRFRRVRGRVIVTAGYLVMTVAAWLVARPALGVAPWTAFESTPTSIGSVLTSAPMGLAPAYAIGVLTIAGVVVAVRSPRRWWPLLALFAGAAAIYIVGASFAEGVVRDLLTAVWYRDNFRLAALLPVATLPLATLGATRIAEAGARLWRRPSRPDRALIVGVVLALILVPLTQTRQLREVEARIHEVFTPTAEARLVSPDEAALISRVADVVPADGVVVGDPSTGASLVYALAGRQALAPHIFGDRTPDEQYLLDHWDEAATDPRVCDLIRAHNAYWALAFPGPDALGRPTSFAGLDQAASARGIRLVDSTGDARLYEVTVCGPVPSAR